MRWNLIGFRLFLHSEHSIHDLTLCHPKSLNHVSLKCNTLLIPDSKLIQSICKTVICFFRSDFCYSTHFAKKKRKNRDINTLLKFNLIDQRGRQHRTRSYITLLIAHQFNFKSIFFLFRCATYHADKEQQNRHRASSNKTDKKTHIFIIHWLNRPWLFRLFFVLKHHACYRVLTLDDGWVQ